MAHISGRKSNKWMYVWAAVVVAALVIATITALTVEKARIEGDTPEARIASICRVADESLWGAGDAIAEAAVNDPAPAVRRAALIALGKFVEPKYRPMLESATRAEDPDVRSAAAVTLGTYADDPAADRLGEVAANDPDEQVRKAAVEGLERCVVTKAVVHLVETLEKNDNPTVQQYARSAVRRRLKLIARNTRPDDVAMWRNDAELLKGLPVVIAAYKTCSVPLVHHPEYIIPEPGE